MNGYAIISLGGKQYRVQEGQRLLVDRLGTDEGKTFTPDVLLVGGNGRPDLKPKAGLVTARVVGHLRGPKIRIGKYKPKSGYRRHTGFRSSLSQIEIESIGARKPEKPKAEEKPKAAAKPKTTAKPKAKAAAKPKPKATRSTTKKAEKADGA
jgi:large subunit ribosomal protein L21